MPCPSPTELPDPIKPGSPALHANSLSSESPNDQHKKIINTPTCLLFPCQSQMNCIQWWLWVPSLLLASGDLLLKMGNAPKRLLKSREQTLTNANLLLAFLGLTSFFPFAFPHSYRPKEPPLPFLPACNSVLIVDTTAILNYVTLD